MSSQLCGDSKQQLPASAIWCDDKEAAALAGYSVGTLRNWRSTGQKNAPPFYKRENGGKVRYKISDVVAWVEKQQRQDTGSTWQRPQRA